VDFGLHGGFIPGTEYEREIQNLYQLGLTGMKTFTCSAMPEWPPCYDGDLYDALKIVQDVGAVALLHSENEFLISKNEKRLRSEARTDIKAYLESRTPITEIESAHRMVFFLKQTHAKGLIVHTSVPEAVLEVKAAKDEGYAVCVETCPHYLFLTEEDIVSHRPFSKTAPPARDKDRVAKMWQLLNLGYIDTLASDHSPCTMEERMTALRNIWDGRNGASNIEASLPLMMNAINTGRTTLNRVIQVACENPAKLFGLYPRKGTLQVSSDADFVVVDMNATHELSNEMTKSKCGWTLYDGFATQGAPRMVFLRGNMIMQDGEILGRQGYGQFVTRDGIT
jgi:dihydroorotase-like cyclic amidohydrolase